MFEKTGKKEQLYRWRDAVNVNINEYELVGEISECNRKVKVLGNSVHWILLHTLSVCSVYDIVFLFMTYEIKIINKIQ